MGTSLKAAAVSPRPGRLLAMSGRLTDRRTQPLLLYFSPQRVAKRIPFHSAFLVNPEKGQEPTCLGGGGGAGQSVFSEPGCDSVGNSASHFLSQVGGSGGKGRDELSHQVRAFGWSLSPGPQGFLGPRDEGRGLFTDLVRWASPAPASSAPGQKPAFWTAALKLEWGHKCDLRAGTVE